MSDLGTGMVSHTSIRKRKSTTVAVRIICLLSSWTWNLCGKVMDPIEELICFYLKRIRFGNEIRHRRHFEFGNLTCLAVVSFEPIRALARVTVISSYCAGSSILARGVCA